MKKLLFSMVALALSAGCGGGGGKGTASDGWITFDPASLHVTLYDGEASQWIEVSGTARSLPSAPVTVLAILDGTILEEPQLTRTGDLTYRLRAKVKVGLSAGTHHGNIEVRACEDDPLVCGRPYGGSPFHLPVDVVMAADPGYPTSPPNGDFSAGTAGWTTYVDPSGSAAASLSVTGGALHVAIADGGLQYYSVQVSCTPGIDVEQGKHYRLDLDAWADTARTIRVSVQENGRDLDGDGSPYDTYLSDGLAPVSLTTSAQHFQYTWTQPVTNRKANVDFFCGAEAADVYVDNVTIVEVP